MTDKAVENWFVERYKWDLAHAYFRYAANGKVPYVYCPEDQTELVLVARGGFGGEPALRCMTCLAVYTISVPMWDAMQDNMKEANEQKSNP